MFSIDGLEENKMTLEEEDSPQQQKKQTKVPPGQVVKIAQTGKN